MFCFDQVVIGGFLFLRLPFAARCLEYDFNGLFGLDDLEIFVEAVVKRVGMRSVEL